MASNQTCLPVPRRRKRTSSDGEEESALSFHEIESMGAMDYMAAVVEQASSMPDHFVATNKTVDGYRDTRLSAAAPIDGSASSLAYLVSDRTSILEPPTRRHIPLNAPDWVDATLGNFSQLRHYLETCYRNGVGEKASSQYMVPPLRDRAGWHVFCVGREEARGNVGSYFDEDEHNSSDEEPVSSWLQKVPPTGHEPSVRLLCQTDQVMVRRVISHLCYYLHEGWPCTSQRSAWLYALLANLERPLHREDAALLYGLLKQLTHTRAEIDVSTDREKLAQLNVLIVIVGIYFEQGGGYHGVMSINTNS